MTAYELTTGTKEDFNTVQAQLINDFIRHVTNAEVTVDWRMPHTGRIISCLNTSNTFESIIATVYFDDTDETKNFVLVAAINCGYLLFVDESVKALYDEFRAANERVKHQRFAATQEARRRQKEELKKAKQKEAQVKKKVEAKAKEMSKAEE